MINLKARNSNITLAQKMMKGDDGGYYTPSVDENGNLTWQPSEEEMPSIPSSNISGPVGPMGESGVYVGEVEPTDEEVLVWLNPEGDISGYVMSEKQVKEYIDKALTEVEYGTY